MRFRKLQIAWSVACGIICLLLIGLWVRSYWWWDQYEVSDGLEPGDRIVVDGGLFVQFMQNQ